MRSLCLCGPLGPYAKKQWFCLQNLKATERMELHASRMRAFSSALHFGCAQETPHGYSLPLLRDKSSLGSWKGWCSWHERFRRAKAVGAKALAVCLLHSLPLAKVSACLFFARHHVETASPEFWKPKLLAIWASHSRMT